MELFLFFRRGKVCGQTVGEGMSQLVILGCFSFQTGIIRKSFRLSVPLYLFFQDVFFPEPWGISPA